MLPVPRPHVNAIQFDKVCRYAQSLVMKLVRNYVILDINASSMTANSMYLYRGTYETEL